MKYWLALFLLLGSGTPNAESWRFGLMGDVPYSARERRELPHMLKAMANAGTEVIVHIGDIKSGQERCDDSLFEDRYQAFNASLAPFVYVPGDNEWTDCDRLSNGPYEPVERLARLRQIFFKESRSLGQKQLAVEQQSGTYREQQRFRLGPVLFVTLNLPGNHNNYGNKEIPSSEFSARMPAVIRWLKEGFALARQEQLAGVVLLFQANPGFKHFAQGLSHRGYRDFLETLQQEVSNFAGHTVAVHGDTHWSRIDHPLRDAAGKTIERFTRVETFGYPLMGWTKGVIDRDHPTLFKFETYPWAEQAAQ